MANWLFPLAYCHGIPIGTHPGAFGATRRQSRHTGVDLYTRDKECVLAAENGLVAGWEHFTGPQDGTPWWMNTDCLIIMGQANVICYGEMLISKEIMKIGTEIKRGQCIGNVTPVVREGKERPDIPGHSRAMLHIEVYTLGRNRASTHWEPGKPQHDYLLDPTPFLISADGCPEARFDMPEWPEMMKA